MLEYLYGKTLNKDIKELINYVKRTGYKYKNETVDYLTGIINKKYQLYCDINIFKNILNIIMLNQQNSGFIDDNVLAQNLYKTNVPLEPTDTDLKNFYNLYNVLLKSNYNTIFKSFEIFINISNIYNSFENKNIALLLFERIGNIPSPKININGCLDCISDYVIKSRIYYTDEHAYFNAIINLLNSYFFDNEINTEYYEKNKKLNIEQLKLDKKLAGVYDIDEEKIKELEEKIKILEDKIDKSNKDILTLNQNCEDLKENSGINSNENLSLFNELFNKEESILIAKLKTINNNFKIKISNRDWLTKTVVDTFGFNFVANSDSSEQKFISYIVNNNLLEKWKELFTINPNFTFYSQESWFNDETIRILGIEYLANTSKNTQSVISDFSNDQLELLKNILSINPKFEFYTYPFVIINYNWIIDNYVFDKVGIKYIANASLDQILSVMAFYHHNSDNLSKLQKVLILKPEFSINFKSSICPLEDGLETFIKNSDEEEIIQFLSSEISCKHIRNKTSQYIECFCALSDASKIKLIMNSTNDDSDYKMLKTLGKLDKAKKLLKVFKPQNNKKTS